MRLAGPVIEYWASATATSDRSVLRSLVSALVSLPLRATITSTLRGRLHAGQAALILVAALLEVASSGCRPSGCVGASARKCLLVRAL